MRRYTPLAPSRGTVWPPKVRAEILDRDEARCVGARAKFPAHVLYTCRRTPVELDHVRAGGTGMKSESTVANGVCLDAFCHRWKTEHGKEARPLLLDYIARATTGCDHVDPVFGCASCQGRAYLAGVGT